MLGLGMKKSADLTVVSEFVSIKTVCPFCQNEISIDGSGDVDFSAILNVKENLVCHSCGESFKKSKIKAEIKLP